MSDIIINVSAWMRENVRDVNVDLAEKEVLAYLSMAMMKLYLLGETSKRFNWSEDFKKAIRGAGPALMEMATIEEESGKQSP